MSLEKRAMTYETSSDDITLDDMFDVRHDIMSCGFGVNGFTRLLQART